ncbi:hypothetical protein OESDEN_14146, partial [Oesophagostomum dentatum]
MTLPPFIELTTLRFEGVNPNQVSISLHDVRWQTGAIEELEARIGAHEDEEQQQDVAGEKVCGEFDPFEGLDSEGEHKCTSCGWSLDDEDRDAILGHYKSQWHWFNLKHVLKGRPALTEEEFEELEEEERKGDEPESSSSDSDDSDYDDVLRKLGSSHLHFVHNDEVFSMY